MKLTVLGGGGVRMPAFVRAVLALLSLVLVAAVNA